MGFKAGVKEKALIACKRYCVLCEMQKGKKIECHHIMPKAKGGDNSFDNCIPLCFDCHEEVGSYNPEHPKGNKYRCKELKTRRDDFYKKVKNGDVAVANHIVPNLPNVHDIELYNMIKAIFNSPNLKDYLSEYDLGNDFDNNVFTPLYELSLKENDVEFEFVDDEIEGYKLKLFQSIMRFLNYKAANTWPTDFGTQALGTWKNYDYTHEESRKIIREFNDLASGVWDTYSDLIRVCKRKL